MEEDIGLCRAFVATTNENATDIFGRMYHHFVGLAPPSGDDGDRWRARTERALKKRLIVVRPTVLLFCKYYAKVVTMGGLSEERAISAAMDEFQAGCHHDPKKDGAHQDNVFKYLHCWRILRHAAMYRKVCEGVTAALSNAQDQTGATNAVLANSVSQGLADVEDIETETNDIVEPSLTISGRKRVRTSGGTPGVPSMVQGHHLGSGAVPNTLAGMSNLQSTGEPMGNFANAVGNALGDAVAGDGSDGRAVKRARDTPGVESSLNTLSSVGERFARIAEEICGVFVFQRPDANPVHREEFFRLAEESRLLRMRRLVAAERQATAAIEGNGRGE